MTIYTPGMDTKDAVMAINDTHFSITGPNPEVALKPNICYAERPGPDIPFFGTF